MRRRFPLVIRKTGETFIPNFPINLKAGDQLLLVEETAGSQVPEGKIWIAEGCSYRGPQISEIKDE